MSWWLAIVWSAELILLVRIASEGEFTWYGLTSAYGEDPRQVIALLLAAAGNVLFAVRALRRGQGGGVDRWSVGWSVLMAVVGGALWRLGHDSAPVILILAILGGVLAYVHGLSGGAG